VILRHELRHRRDRELLEARVRERTADLEAALSERSAMLQEIHHRVKNNLQVIISMLKLETERRTDPASRALLETSVQRIYAMSLVHETLYDTDKLDVIDLVRYAELLLESVRSASKNEYAIKASAPVPVGLDFAVPFGLLLNELVSNVERHAYPKGARGRVEVQIESKDGILFTIRDDGVGIPEVVDIEGPETLGLSLVGALVKQLSGVMALDRDEGTRWTIRFPAAEGGREMGAPPKPSSKPAT
jgi:two-component sensor histidine kinase